jgi:ribonuclease PH
MTETPKAWKKQMRPVRIERDVSRFSDGSVLIETGDTRVICGARIQHYVPNWKESEGGGWVTAEYSMIPSSAPRRQRRDRFGYTDKRSLEIERVISRALRSVVDLDLIGQRTVQVDCDVIQAAGGTRTASITGGWVALHGAFEQMQDEKLITQNPLKEPLAAISVGIVNGEVVVDLDYQQDSHASVDLNIAMTESGEFAEIQGTGEEYTFPANRLNDMIDQAVPAIETLTSLQGDALDQSQVLFDPGT